MKPLISLITLSTGLLGGCAPVDVPNSGPPAFVGAEIQTGPNGLCYGMDTTPAVIETEVIQALDQAAVLAEDGTVLSPAIYSSISRQRIVRERQQVAFETLCPPAYTPAFVQSLQRALRARGYYHGQLNAVLDAETGRAIQDYQRQTGPDSPLLSFSSAQSLGLVALTQAQIDALDAD